MADTLRLAVSAWLDGESVPLAGWRTLEATTAHMRDGTCTLAFDVDDNPYLADLLRDDLAITISNPDTGLQWWSGVLDSRTMELPSESKITVPFMHDIGILHDVLVAPDPTKPITQQPSTNWTMTGPAETVAKKLISANFARLGIPITVMPDKGRGQQITVDTRWITLWDALVSPAQLAGIGLRFTRDSNGRMVLDCYATADDVLQIPLRVASGMVDKLTWTNLRPDGTRAVVGGWTDSFGHRSYLPVVNGAAESRIGRPREVFLDMSSTTAATTGDDMTLYGLQELAKLLPKDSLTITLAGRGVWAYGTPQGLQVGTTVTIDILGQFVTDVVTEAHITQNADDGTTISCSVGSLDTSDPNVLIAAKLDQLRAGLARLHAR